jgi:hypothetical protein
MKICGNFGKNHSALLSSNWNGENGKMHAISKTRQYHIWQAMKTRCGNPHAINYSKYGGSGITYDPSWELFQNFWKDMKEGYFDNLTIERIDNSKGYSKENCIWADYSKQNNNRNYCVFLKYNGKTKTITEWATELGINRKSLYWYHNLGLSDSEIMKRATKVRTKCQTQTQNRM